MGERDAGLEGVWVLEADGGPSLPIVERGGEANAVVWPGMGAQLRSLHRISLRADGCTVRMQHPSEAVYYVVSGRGQVIDPADGRGQELEEGSMVHVDPGSPYLFQAAPAGMDLVGGPAPPDPRLYEGLGDAA